MLNSKKNNKRKSGSDAKRKQRKRRAVRRGSSPSHFLIPVHEEVRYIPPHDYAIPGRAQLDLLLRAGTAYYLKPREVQPNSSSVFVNGDYETGEYTSLDLLRSPLRKDTLDDWTPKEIALFEASICAFGKDFHAISQHIQSKTTKNVVQFYYTIWKHSQHYYIWKAHKVSCEVQFRQQLTNATSTDDISQLLSQSTSNPLVSLLAPKTAACDKRIALLETVVNNKSLNLGISSPLYHLAQNLVKDAPHSSHFYHPAHAAAEHYHDETPSSSSPSSSSSGSAAVSPHGNNNADQDQCNPTTATTSSISSATTPLDNTLNNTTATTTTTTTATTTTSTTTQPPAVKAQRASKRLISLQDELNNNAANNSSAPVSRSIALGKVKRPFVSLRALPAYAPSEDSTHYDHFKRVKTNVPIQSGELAGLLLAADAHTQLAATLRVPAPSSVATQLPSTNPFLIGSTSAPSVLANTPQPFPSNALPTSHTTTAPRHMAHLNPDNQSIHRATIPYNSATQSSIQDDTSTCVPPSTPAAVDAQSTTTLIMLTTPGTQQQQQQQQQSNTYKMNPLEVISHDKDFVSSLRNLTLCQICDVSLPTPLDLYHHIRTQHYILFSGEDRPNMAPSTEQSTSSQSTSSHPAPQRPPKQSIQSSKTKKSSSK